MQLDLRTVKLEGHVATLFFLHFSPLAMLTLAFAWPGIMVQMPVSIIVAATCAKLTALSLVDRPKGGIGKDGSLPWKLPQEWL